jgi:hypothetical protein
MVSVTVTITYLYVKVTPCFPSPDPTQLRGFPQLVFLPLVVSLAPSPLLPPAPLSLG